MKSFDTAVRLLREGEYKKAQKILEGIVAKKPRETRALINLGVAYKNRGLLSEAIKIYLKAIELKPKSFAAYNNLANAYLEQNRFELAKENFLKAIEIKPDYAEGYGNLGVYYQTKGNKTLAKKYYNKAISFNPNLFDTLSNLSGILQIEGNNKIALELARRALEIDPDNAYACNNLANILRSIGDLDEARKCYRKAVKLDPRLAGVYANLLDLLLRLGEWGEAEKIHKKMDGLGAETPFLALRLHRDLNHHLTIARSFSTRIEGEAMRSNLRLGYWLKRKKEKIRIGYLSGNFCKHPIGFVISPIFSLHDRKMFKVFAYSYGPNDRSDVLNEIMKSVDEFVDIKGLSDAQAARKINKSRIDILIDLTGHTEGGRMGILANRPSPFQISYLGFCGTSGAEFIDYMIVDKTLVPKKEAKFYSEKLIYMPDCYQINDGTRKVSDETYTKSNLLATSKFRDAERSVVFCSFNRPFKFGRQLLGAWMKILKRVPKSVLVLWHESKTTDGNLKRFAKKEGIDPNRLIFVEGLPKEEHLSRLSVCDLALDPYEYSGGATTANALLVGVPVITVKGYSYLSRMSDSMLHSAGLSTLIAKSLNEYVTLVVALAKNKEKLAKLKRKVSTLATKSKLFNAPLFVKNLEAEYLKIMGSGKENRE